MAAADHKGGWKPAEGTSDHFEKMLEGPCLNHSFPVKHLYKDCGLMKQFLSGGFNRGEHVKDPKPTTDDAKGKDGGFLDARWLPHDLRRVGGLRLQAPPEPHAPRGLYN